MYLRLVLLDNQNSYRKLVMPLFASLLNINIPHSENGIIGFGNSEIGINGFAHNLLKKEGGWGEMQI